MLHTVITTDKNFYPLHIPNEYIGKKIEIIIFSSDEGSKTYTQNLTNKFKFKNIKINATVADFNFNRDELHER